MHIRTIHLKNDGTVLLDQKIEKPHYQTDTYISLMRALAEADLQDGFQSINLRQYSNFILGKNARFDMRSEIHQADEYVLRIFNDGIGYVRGYRLFLYLPLQVQSQFRSLLGVT